jgi:hypothetical protein
VRDVEQGMLPSGSSTRATACSWCRRVVEEEGRTRPDRRDAYGGALACRADGASSFVRDAGITRRDLGFQERWLVVDAEPHDYGAGAPADRQPAV